MTRKDYRKHVGVFIEDRPVARDGREKDSGKTGGEQDRGEAGFGSQAQVLKPLAELQAGPKLE
jgi:hypothetical protein